MKLLLGVAGLLLVHIVAAADKARYDNYRVYSVSVDNQLQLKVLKELAEVSDSVSIFEILGEPIDKDLLQYSFWDSPHKVGVSVDLLVPPHQLAHFGELVEKYKFEATLTISNLQE